MAVRGFLLTDDNELDVSGGRLHFREDGVAVVQSVKIKLSVILGEIFLDADLGVDWLNKILVRNPDHDQVRAILGARIASVPDVLEVVGSELVVDRALRAGAISFQMRDAFSTEGEPITAEVESPVG